MTSSSKERAARPQLAAMVVAVAVLVLASIALFHAAGSAGVVAWDAVSPITLLGTTPDTRTCASAPLEIGAGTAVVCSNWNGVLSRSGEVRVVTLHSVGDSSVIDPWRGPLPGGLAWGNSIRDVVATLDEPDRITSIYGTPTFVYMFRTQPFGSLELRFDKHDRLASINASVDR